MEGDKIIQTLKNCSTGRPTDLEKVCASIKRFLSPLTSSTCGNPAKYELFCLKSLKACVDVLVNSSSVPNGYKDIVNVLIDALDKCFGSNNKIPELSCEKVLLHIVKEYCVKRYYNDQLRIAQLLQSLLCKKSTDQAASLHKNITDLLWRTSSHLENLLCLQFRLTAILSMINGRCSDRVIVESIVKCSSWYQMTSSGSCDPMIYNRLEQCLPHTTELGNMSLFLCHYCKVCYDNSDNESADNCLKRLSSLSVQFVGLLEGIIILIRTCHLIEINVEEDHLVLNINKATAKLKALGKSTVVSTLVFVVEWLNKLLTSSSYTTSLLAAVHQLEQEHYLPYVCDKKKLVACKMLLNLLFAQVKNVVEDGGQLLEQSTELVLSVIRTAERCCDQLGCASDHGCLGNIIFNIGLAMSRGHKYMESCELLSVACKQLRLLCNADGAYIHKVQLANKYHLLYNCQRKAGYHDEALDTLKMEISCIPVRQLSDDGIPPDLLSCWVKTSCTISCKYRSIVDVLEPRPSDHVITMILEAELMECRNNGSVEVWHDAIIRLAEWYKDKGHVLLQARLMVEQSEWCLYHGDNALDHCKKALIVLDGCHSNTEEWHYTKGLAHFWQGVCLYSLLIRSCDASAGSCDSIVDALLDGITEWEGITMETSGIDYYHSYQLLQTILHLSSLLLELTFEMSVSENYVKALPRVLYENMERKEWVLCFVSRPLFEFHIFHIARAKAMFRLAWRFSFSDTLPLLSVNFIIQLRVVNIMMCLTAGNHGDWMEKAHTDCLYQCCDVLTGVNIPSPLSSWQHGMSCDNLLICCKYHMIQGEISKAFEVLQSAIQCCEHKDYYNLAGIKFLYSKLLQCRNPTSLLSSKSLLDHVRQREHNNSHSSSQPTSLELLLEALQLLRMLCKNVKSSPDNDHGWLLLGKLLECLYHVITLLCWHGNCREAIYYYKEADNLCEEYKLYYWKVRFMNLLIKVEILRGQSSCDVMATMSTILCHSFKGDSLVCNHSNKKSWKDSNNPHYLALLCHLIHCHVSLCDAENVIGLINLANQIAVFATSTCSKYLQGVMNSKAGADISDFFKWVELAGYIIHYRHLIDIDDVSSAISLPPPVTPTHCCSAETAVLWAELCLVRGVALAKAVLDNKTFLKTCWCYYGNVKMHKACVTSRKRSRDVLADSSPELPHPPVGTVPQSLTEEDSYDDIIFRSEQSASSDLKNLEAKGSKCKGRRNKKSTKKSIKQKLIYQPQPQAISLGICSDELWPAVEMLLLCYQLCHPSCFSVVLRDVSLWIATCIGHHDDQLTAYFLHCSHGNTLHHKMVEVARKKYQLNNSGNYKSFDTVSDNVELSSTDNKSQLIQDVLQWNNMTLPPTLGDFDRLLSHLAGHAIVSLNLSPYCSPAHLLLSRIQYNTQPLIHCVTSVGDNLLDQFSDIISQAKVAATSTEKSTFWRRRRQFNQDLEDLLITIERVWLGAWKILLLGDHLDESALQDTSEELVTIIKSANGNCCNNVHGWLKLLINSIDQLNSSEFNEFLTTVTMGTVSVAHMSEIHKVIQDFNSHISSESKERKPVTILLGRLLHRLPWEQLPSLQIQPITRMPSFPVLVAHYILLGKCHEVTVDTSNCYYMLNPSGNLGNTEKTFSKWFSSEPGWDGVVGKVTSEDHMIKISKHQLFIYCGHGAGQEYLHGDNIQKLHNMATSFLIGCSSGQLLDVGSLDPTGTVFSYLMAASPAVIANLWDVTDADTDRFCKALLQSWLCEKGASLVSMVSPSRLQCKLPYLVGGAAVMYGFPCIINNKAHSL